MALSAVIEGTERAHLFKKEQAEIWGQQKTSRRRIRHKRRQNCTTNISSAWPIRRLVPVARRGLCGASPEAEMTESRAQRPTFEQIEDRVSVVKQLREQFKEDKVCLRTLDADLLCLQMTLNWRREQKSYAIDNGPIRGGPREPPPACRIPGLPWTPMTLADIRELASIVLGRCLPLMPVKLRSVMK
jgi:hypothetical protein